MIHTRSWLGAAPATRRAIQPALIAGCLAMAACGSGDSPVSAADNPRAEVRQLLRERAHALAAGDVDAYLEPVAANARDVETIFAEGAAAVPLAELHLTLAEADIDRATGTVQDATIEVVYRYEGVPDDNPLRAELTLDLEQRDSDWTVTDAELGQPAPVWATGDVAVTRSENFLVLSRPGVGDHDAIVEMLEDARRRIADQLELPLDPVHVLMLAGGTEEFAAFAGPDRPANAIAVAVWQFRTAGRAGQARAQHRQMIVNLNPARAGLTLDHHGAAKTRPQAVFAHELAHLVLHRFTYPHTPRWVVEGGAMYLAEERRRGGWQAGVEQDAFVERSIVDLDDELDSLDYAYANAVVLYLVEQEGSERFWKFYRSFRDADSTDETARILTHHYGFDADELDQRVREWVHDTID